MAPAPIRLLRPKARVEPCRTTQCHRDRGASLVTYKRQQNNLCTNLYAPPRKPGQIRSPRHNLACLARSARIRKRGQLGLRHLVRVPHAWLKPTCPLLGRRLAVRRTRNRRYILYSRLRLRVQKHKWSGVYLPKRRRRLFRL